MPLCDDVIGECMHVTNLGEENEGSVIIKDLPVSVNNSIQIQNNDPKTESPPCS